MISGESVVGGGSAPDTRRETVLLAIRRDDGSASEIERKLRTAETPVITRIEDDAVLIDLRTVQEDEEDRLIEMIVKALR